MLRRIALLAILLPSAAGAATWSRTVSGYPPFSRVGDAIPIADGGVMILTANPCLTRFGDTAYPVSTVCGEYAGARLAASKDSWYWYGSFQMKNSATKTLSVGSVTGGELQVRWATAVEAPDGDLTMDAGAVTADGSLVVAGSFDVSAAVVKVNPSGKVVWKKILNLSEKETLDGIAPASDGGVVAVGRGRGRQWLVKLDAAGTLLWQTFGGPGAAYAVAAMPSDGFAVAGLLDGHPWVALVDGNGVIRWQKAARITKNAPFHRVMVMPGGEIVAAGSWDGLLHLAAFTRSGESSWQVSLPVADPHAVVVPAGDGLLIAAAGTAAGTLQLYRLDAHAGGSSCVAAQTGQSLAFDSPPATAVKYDIDTADLPATSRPAVFTVSNLRPTGSTCQEETHRTSEDAARASAAISAREGEIAGAAQELSTRVRAMLTTRQFAALTRLGEQLAASHETFDDGPWKLRVYHDALAAEGQSLPEDQHIAVMEEWRRAEPKSAPAAVAAADTYVTYAWRARGGGYSNTISKSGSQKFEALMEKADSVLRAAVSSGARDPHYFYVRATVSGGYSGDLDAVIHSTSFRDCHYPAAYRAAMWFQLPRWGGTPAKVGAFNEYAADAVGGDAGDALYARLVSDLLNAEGSISKEYGIDDARVHRGALAYVRFFPGPFSYHRMAHTMWMMGDAEGGRELFRRPELAWGDFAKEFWGTRESYDVARNYFLGLPLAVPGPSQPTSAPTLPQTSAPAATPWRGKAPATPAAPSSTLAKPASSSWISGAASTWPAIVLGNRLVLKDGKAHDRFTSFLLETSSGTVAVTSLVDLDIRETSPLGTLARPMDLAALRIRLADWTMTAPGHPAEKLVVTSIVDMPDRMPSRSAVTTVSTKAKRLPVAVLKPATEPFAMAGRVFVIACRPAGPSCTQTAYTAEVQGKQMRKLGDFGSLQLHFDEPVQPEDLAGSVVVDSEGRAVAVMSGTAYGRNALGPWLDAEEIGSVLQKANLKR